jgi:hypothetical protein
MWNALSVVCFRHRGPRLLKLVEFLIQNGIVVNNTNESGWNPLFALSSNLECEKSNFFGIINVLIDAGIKINNRSKNDCHFLIPLTTNHHQNPDFEKIIQFLVTMNGLDINATNSKGKHIFIIILEKLVDSKTREDDLFKIVKLFIAFGISPRIRRCCACSKKQRIQ